MAELTSQKNDHLNIAFSLHTNPTAWGAFEDLVTCTADLTGTTPSDPMARYQARCDEAPTYQGVLEHIAPTQFARQCLLRGYFEQDVEYVAPGRKLPTIAHRASTEATCGVVRIAPTQSRRIQMRYSLDRSIVRRAVAWNHCGG